MRGVFDIVGPIMIGPSSSHTAGAARLGLMARKILGEKPVEAHIQFAGSFAQTYRGHGTDKAIIGGIMGFATDDARLRDALDLASEKGLKYSFEPLQLLEVHPNTAIITLTGEYGKTIQVQGASIGGGNIEISRIGDYQVHLTGEYPALLVIHRDRPGMISDVTRLLAGYKINVAFMRLSRQSRGKQALMILETDEELSEEIVESCQAMKFIEVALAIPGI